MTAAPPFYRSKWFNLAVGILISAVCLWWAARDILQDPAAQRQVVLAFRTANYASLPVIFLTLFVFYWLKAWRWRLLLSPVGRYGPLKDLFGPVMIGFSFNNLLPMRIGEFVRCFVFARQHQLPLMVSLSSVVLERIFDGVAVVFYLSIGLLFVDGAGPEVTRAATIFSVAAAIVVAGGLAYVLWTKPFVDLLERILLSLPLLPKAFSRKVCRILETGAAGLASLKDIRLLLGILVLSLVKWALNGAVILLSLWSFDLPATLPIGMVLMGVIAFGVAIPSSPGYFGVIQLLFMQVLALFTVDRERVFAASVYYHLAQYIPVTLTGLIFFIRSGVSLRQVEAVEEQVHERVAPEPLAVLEPESQKP